MKTVLLSAVTAAAVSAVVVFAPVFLHGDYEHPEKDEVVPKLLVSFSTGNQSSGSGIYIGNDTILTAKHVVASPDGVVFPDIRVKTLEGGLLRISQVKLYDNDLAAVVVAEHSFKTAAEVDCSPLRPGDRVFALGHPLGMEYVYTFGRVATKKQDIGPWPNAQLVNTTVGYGMSGGSLFTSSGKVAGVIVGIIAGLFSLSSDLAIVLPGETVCAAIPSR